MHKPATVVRKKQEKLRKIIIPVELDVFNHLTQQLIQLITFMQDSYGINLDLMLNALLFEEF